MSAVWEHLGRQSKTTLVVAGFVLVAVIGVADYSSGYELSFSIFYLIPVGLVAWGVGRTVGFLISIASAITWYAADLAAGHPYSHPAVPLWNALVRFGFFLIVTYLLADLHQAVRHETELARSDPLTGIANRRSFIRTAEREIGRARRYKHPFTVVYLDLDNFKTVNDRWGHHTGDALLQTVAHTIHSRIRAVDLVARMGGDEFAILLPETPDGAARVFLSQLQGHLLDAMRKRQWPVTFSIGALSFTECPSSLDEVMKKVDAVMYEAKHEGKNSIKHETVLA